MTDSYSRRGIIANTMLDSLPPLIYKSLLNDQSFREAYGLGVEAILTLGEDGFSIQSSILFDAVQAVFAGGGLVELTDIEGRKWELVLEVRSDGLPNLIFSSDQQRIAIAYFAVLSGEVSTRIRFLEKLASDVNLPLSAQEKWISILKERALEADELNDFLSDIHDTPVYVEQVIRNKITTGESRISYLVPNSHRYFERLIGSYSGSGSIRDYAAGTGRTIFEQLMKWCPYEGFLLSLLLSSHSALTAAINVEHLGQEELEKAFDYLEKHGDILSRLGAFEVGLRVLSDRPEVKTFLLGLVHRIRDDNVEGKTSEFKLFSALFVLVDGELARTRLLADKPPFYRRLASLTQAALIHRQIIQCRIDYDHLSTSAFSKRGNYFYMQSLSDMRTEPRWNPDWATASQLQADFFGRIMIAGNNFKENLNTAELRDAVLGNGDQSLNQQCEFPRQYFPGPLEGTENSPNALPDSLARIIEEQFESNELTAASFIALVNSAMLFKISHDQAELAAKALRLGKHTLANLENKSQLVGILNGLAKVAAVSRSPALADELCFLVRRYRRDSQYGFSIKEAIRISLVASAARENLLEWREFAGAWLTELAFGELEKNEGVVLYSHLLVLLHVQPELWFSCSRAEAALQAWCLC